MDPDCASLLYNRPLVPLTGDGFVLTRYGGLLTATISMRVYCNPKNYYHGQRSVTWGNHYHEGRVTLTLPAAGIAVRREAAAQKLA